MAIESFAVEGAEVLKIEADLNKWLRTHPSHAVHDFIVNAAGMKQVVIVYASPTDSVSLQAAREFKCFIEGDAQSLCDRMNTVFAKDPALAVIQARGCMEGGVCVSVVYATRIGPVPVYG